MLWYNYKNAPSSTQSDKYDIQSLFFYIFILKQTIIWRNNYITKTLQYIILRYLASVYISLTMFFFLFILDNINLQKKHLFKIKFRQEIKRKKEKRKERKRTYKFFISQETRTKFTGGYK